jgi:hypothetical protein
VATMRFPSFSPYLTIIALVPLCSLAIAAGAGHDE